MAAACPILAIVPPNRNAAEVIYQSHGGLAEPPGVVVGHQGTAEDGCQGPSGQRLL